MLPLIKLLCLGGFQKSHRIKSPGTPRIKKKTDIDAPCDWNIYLYLHLAGAHPPTKCSFARQLVGKMAILAAHLLIQEQGFVLECQWIGDSAQGSFGIDRQFSWIGAIEIYRVLFILLHVGLQILSIKNHLFLVFVPKRSKIFATRNDIGTIHTTLHWRGAFPPWHLSLTGQHEQSSPTVAGYNLL